ncbi:MAG: hypothetical protein IJV58_08575, partial [Oscillospiraceae bacterium]|nr:hypothetical protein [Oscillospiraceae bacterium]
MSTKQIFLLCLALVGCAACSAPVRVVWTEGATDPDSGKTVHQLEVQNPPSGTDWTLWFCQFRTPVKMLEGAAASIEHVSGTLYRVVPETDTHGEAMTLRYEARALVNRCRAPEGFYLQRAGKKPVPVEASYSFLPAEPI